LEMNLKFDNERDRFAHGFDAGQIIDGEVVLDAGTGRYVLMDEDGVGFDPQAALAALAGQRIRLTMISHRSIQRAEELMAEARKGALPPGGD
jgi:hypothetical protein